MKIMIVVGARPNFMKAAPILAAAAQHQNAGQDLERDLGKDLEKEKMECVLVHTGQHYDTRMSDAIFADLNLPPPDVFLGVGSGSHAAQTAEIMKRFEPVLLEHNPQVVVVAGDVNSTIACALTAAKINFELSQRRPLIAHVEAGLRSGDRSMPEEVNRILTDHVSDILFVTEESGLRNLQKEGIPQERIFFVGNTMIDSLLASREKAEKSAILANLQLKTGSEVKPYALLTLHRPSNVDQRETLQEILEGLRELSGEMPVIFPAHPRTQKQIQENGLGAYFRTGNSSAEKENPTGILMIDPQGYLDFLCLMQQARLVVTDSGGIQEETTGLGVPCVTVRENTERPVTVESGTNILAGVRRQGIQQAIQRQLRQTGKGTVPKFWDGAAGRRIMQILVQQVAARGLAKAQSLS